jgi:ubiquinone biosynthesis protein
MKSGLRAWRIGRVLVRYRLDDLLEQTALERWLRLMRPFVPRASPDIAALPRGARLRLALQELGPIFVKFGQILSTRRDLVPVDVAEELTLLQDRVAPFDGDTARVLVEQALGLSIGDAFASFDTTPLASASVAQVHAATLHAGTSPGSSDAAPREVVVKVLRPGIKRQIAADVALLKTIAALVDRTHPAADKIRPREIVAEIESTLAAELDLQREGANASVLRRFWLDSPDLYVPEVVWSHTAERVLTLERVHGIPSDDIIALDAAGIDRKVLAAKGVRVFYTQVFRDNFFHADAHAGNIWVDIDPLRKSNPRFIALDFGIMGQLSSEDQYYLAENFMAIFNRDYRRIAELHVQAGWMPSHIRIDELEAAARSVCEPYFTRPLSKISLAEVLLKLFRTAQRYELTIQPQLILLQKTLLNIEGVGRQLDPQIDIWAVARPVLERILMERYSPQRLFSEFRKRLPEMITQAPDMPRLLHAWLTQQVEGKQQLHMHSRQLDDIADATRLLQRRTVGAILGTGLLIVATVLYALHAGGPLLGGIPAATWIAGLGGVWALLAAWPRRDTTRSR